MFNAQTFRDELLLNDQDIQNGFWFLDELHLPDTLTPLFASYMAPAVTEGTLKAYETLKLPIHQFHIKIKDSHYYQCTRPYEGDIRARIEENIAADGAGPGAGRRAGPGRFRRIGAGACPRVHLRGRG